MEQKIKAMEAQTVLKHKLDEALRAAASAETPNKAQAASKKVSALKV